MIQETTNGTRHALPDTRQIAILPGDSSARIVELPHRICHSPPGNPEITLDMVQELLASVSKHGQLVDAIACPHPDIPGEALVLDGNGRLFVCRQLDIPLRARWLDHVPDEGELITILLTTATIKKTLDKAAIGAAIYRWQGLKEASLDDVAEHFGYKTAGAISKLISPFKNGIEELIDALRNRQIVPACAYLVAALPKDKQREVLPRVLGKKRMAVEAIIAGYKDKRPKGQKTLTLKCGSAVVRMKAGRAVLDGLKTVLNRISDAIRTVEERSVPDALQADLLREILAKA